MKTYLALGDSYTIGEQVLLSDTYAYQAVQVLRQSNIAITAPEIVAKTGWTTGELLIAVEQNIFLKTYDYVSLLIGVNNQYRGSGVGEYENEFEILIKKAIQFVGENVTNVFVLSIPDWGKTTFAKGKDVGKIATEIDSFNNVCKKITLRYKCNYLDITTQQRSVAHNAEMLASDGLHPSKLEYKKWATMLAHSIISHHSV